MLRIFGWALLLILASSGVLGGLIVGAARRANQTLGFSIAIGCALFAAYSLWRLMALNRAIQRRAKEQVLTQPERIIARWGAGADEVILARDGLFVGDSHRPFQSWYCSLQGVKRAGAGLCFTFLAGSGRRRMHRDVEVPLPSDPDEAARIVTAMGEGGLLQA